MRIIERCLQFSIAIMAVLGTWMMSLGGELPGMLPVMIGVAVLSLVFSDILGWFHLHRILVNVVAIAAMLLTLVDFMEHDSTGQLLSIAYLLVSWESVMLFQRKTARVYWCIAVLSLLQVVVASVLNIDVSFKILLFVYLLTGFFGLAFFFLAREFHRVEDRRREAAASGVPSAGLCEESQRTIVERLPLGQMLRSVAGLGIVSAIFAAVYFYGAPRLGGNWRQTRAVATHTGFASRVTLEEMGEVLQNNQPVMRVSFTDYEQKTAYKTFSDLYFHGAVLTHYEDGAWERSQYRSKGERMGTVDPRNAANDTARDYVRMNVLLEPTENATLFTILPAYRPATAKPTEFDFRIGSQQLMRNLHASDQIRFRYSLVTTGMRRGIQSPARPHLQGLNRGAVLQPRERVELLAYDPIQLSGLVEIADSVVSGDSKSRYDVMRALQSHFLNDPSYTYTLQFDRIARDFNIDPIEDFVVNHRHGHCEYFASALTLMLRSQRIPARVVVGFHGGERNNLSGDIQVLQSDAHAWVEAYLEAGDVPNILKTPGWKPNAGVWVRLDPTPASDENSQARTRLDDVLDYAQFLWTDYVLEMNPDRQRETINQAFGAEAPQDVNEAVSGVRTFTRKTMRSIRSWVGGDWFSWRAGVLTSGLLLLLTALARLVYPVIVWLWQRMRLSGRRSPKVRVDFYEQLEAALRKLGLRRDPTQTPREFALEAQCHLREHGLGDVCSIPTEIADAFYDVRYGAVALPASRVEELQSGLTRLALALTSLTSLTPLTRRAQPTQRQTENTGNKGNKGNKERASHG